MATKPKKHILKDGTVMWVAYVREGGRGSKEIRRRFSSNKLALEFMEEFKSEQKRLRESPNSAGSFHETTFQDESQRWLDDLQLRCSPSHHRRVRDVMKEFNASFGNLEPNKINLDFLASLQRKLKQRKKVGAKENWSNASVNRYTEAITAVLNFAVRQRRIPYNPAAGFRKLPRNSPEMLFWEEEEASSFLAWASKKYTELDNKCIRHGRKNYIIYLLALNTGMRAGEIWGLKPRDLFFSENGEGDTIFVRRQYHKEERKLLPLKGSLKTGRDKSRHVPCSRVLRAELEALIQFNKTSPDHSLFHSVHGNHIHHDSFTDRFHRDIEEWGGRRIRFHDLRHTAATLMLSKGVDMKTVSEILGHEDITTTMIYVHLLGNRIKQVSLMFAIQPAEVDTKPTMNPSPSEE